MDAISSMALRLSLMYIHIVIWIKVASSLSLPTVDITIPVNPVQEGKLLTIHCIILRLSTDDTVRISREVNDNAIQMLFLGEETTPHIGNRGSISIRKLIDGYVLYTLTVPRVSRTDQGRYFCSVISIKEKRVIAEDTAFVEVEYTSEQYQVYPQCYPVGNVNYNIQEGTYLRLNCTTESGQGPVSISWIREGEGSLRATDVVRHTYVNNLITSTITTQLSAEDNGTFFKCSVINQVRSVRTCQIGPIILNARAPNPTTISGLTTNLHNNGSPDAYATFLYKIPNWALVIADISCVVVIMGLMAAIVWIRVSSRRKVIGGNQRTQQRRNITQVEYRKNVVPNIYEAV